MREELWPTDPSNEKLDAIDEEAQELDPNDPKNKNAIRGLGFKFRQARKEGEAQQDQAA